MPHQEHHGGALVIFYLITTDIVFLKKHTQLPTQMYLQQQSSRKLPASVKLCLTVNAL